MALFDNVTLPQPSPAEIEAVDILKLVNAELLRRISSHKAGFDKFWHSRRGATPEEIASIMGANASLFFILSQESIRHILTGLSISGLDPAVYFPPEMYTPPREIVINEDGTITILPEPKIEMTSGEELIVDDVTNG